MTDTTLRAQHANSFLTHKVVTSVSLALAILGNFKYAVGRNPVENDPEKDPFFRVGFTPFTANILVLFIYWSLFHLLQVLFVLQFFFPDEATRNSERGTIGSLLNADTTPRLKVASSVGWHFTVFNLLQFFWVLLFAHGHYIWAEIFVIFNFFNILTLYAAHKTYDIKTPANYFIIHFPTAALPLSWILYQLFWNGAVAVGRNGLVARIFANIFIWQLLIVPGAFIAFYHDWAVGLSSSLLVLGLALGQFFTRIFALQWIFAFIISGLLFFASVGTILTSFNHQGSVINDSENAPLINN